MNAAAVTGICLEIPDADVYNPEGQGEGVPLQAGRWVWRHV